MNLINIQLGSSVQPGTGFTVNRYVNAGSFKLVINGTGTEIFELTTGAGGATRRFSFASSGQYTMDAYGVGAFTGTAAKWLAVTAAGLVIEEDPPTGGTITADNGLTMSVATNVQFGSSTSTGSPLLHHTFLYGANTFTFNLNDVRFETDKGANVTAANDLVLGLDGNIFTATGNTQINAITNTNWQSGSFIIIETTGTPLFKHNTAGGAGTLPLKLAGSSDFQSAADDAILFYNNGSFWHELARKQAGQGGRYNFLNYLTESGNTVKFGGLGVDAITTLTAAEKQILITFNSLAGSSGLKLTSTSTAAASSAQVLLEANLSGANVNSSQQTYAIKITNTHTGTGHTNYGLSTVTSGNGRSISAQCTGTGVAIEANNSSTGAAIIASTTGGTGTVIDAQAQAGGLAGRFLVITTGTAAAQLIASVQAQTTGTAAVGFGSRIGFTAETNGNSGRESGDIGFVWVDATDATRTARCLINVYTDVDLHEVLSLAGPQSTLFSRDAATNETAGRFSVAGTYKALTDSTATSFVRINIPSGTVTGGEILITVQANDATDYQSRTLRFIWSAVNKGGTLTWQIQTAEEAVAVSAGTLSVTIDANDAGSGNLDFRANAASSLTETVLRCSYQVFKNIGVGVITPQ